MSDRFYFDDDGNLVDTQAESPAEQPAAEAAKPAERSALHTAAKALSTAVAPATTLAMDVLPHETTAQKIGKGAAVAGAFGADVLSNFALATPMAPAGAAFKATMAGGRPFVNLAKSNSAKLAELGAFLFKGKDLPMKIKPDPRILEKEISNAARNTSVPLAAGARVGAREGAEELLDEENADQKQDNVDNYMLRISENLRNLKNK